MADILRDLLEVFPGAISKEAPVSIHKLLKAFRTWLLAGLSSSGSNCEKVGGRKSLPVVQAISGRFLPVPVPERDDEDVEMS